MVPFTRVRWSLCCAALAGIAGCGGGGGFATDPGESVLVGSVTSFTLASSGGGFPSGRPAGAACDPQIWTYTVHLDAAGFAWDRCDVNNTGREAADYVRATGTRGLSATELDTARAAARMVHVSGQMNCGADKPDWHLSVTSPAGTMVYGDDFYACLMRETAYVDSGSLDHLLTVLESLVGPAP